MKQFLPTLIIALSLPFSALGQTYNYAPNMLNIPCLKEQGDFNLNIGWGRGIVFQALEVQTTYSPLPHFAVMANYFGPRNKSARDKFEIGTDFYLWEVGIGAYEKTPKGSASIFAGYGSGSLFSNFGGDRTADFDLQRLFIQPALSYRSNLFQAGLALRLSRVYYQSGVIAYSIDQQYLQYFKQIEKDSPLFLPELGIQIGMRIKPVTLSLNIATIFPDTELWDFNRLNSGLSIGLDLGLRKKKTSE